MNSSTSGADHGQAPRAKPHGAKDHLMQALPHLLIAALLVAWVAVASFAPLG